MIHIQNPQPDICKAKTFHCPNCQKRRRFLAEHTEWYGWKFTCLTCGDAWDDMGDRFGRPFQRGWREAAVADARKRLKLCLEHKARGGGIGRKHGQGTRRQSR